MHFLELIKNAKKDASTFPEFRLALLADSSTQFLIQALKGLAFLHHIRLEILDPGIDRGPQEILDNRSSLYQFQPRLTFLYYSLQTFKNRFLVVDMSKRTQYAEEQLAEIKQTIAIAKSNGLTSFLLPTFPLGLDAIFGQVGSQLPISFQFQVRHYNYLLSNWASQESGLHILDLETISAEIGHSHFFDPTLYYSSQVEISFQALPKVSKRIIQLLIAQQGNIKKCVIFDLDNTIWGGVVGDDGWENIALGLLGKGKVFTDIQKWLKELKTRGILLCVCSKNEETIAKEAFEKHPDMVLRKEDLVYFAANWKPKNENVSAILEELNIGADSVVYLDDNPAERELIRRSFPEMEIPELPQDPALWLSYLTALALFESSSFSITDADRTTLYRQEQLRKESFQGQDLSSYLKGLEMKAKILSLDTFTIPRAAQLSQRTNQFTLRTQRYSEEELRQFLKEGNKAFLFSLEDKFGDHGIVSFLLLKAEEDVLFVDTWLMSCRVFGRGLEYFVFEQLIQFAKQEGKMIKADYIATAKNKPVETFLPDLGFFLSQGFWFLDPIKATYFPHFIALP